MGNKTGGNTGGVERSPARKKREAARRKAQETRWANKAGPVTVRRVGDECSGTDGGQTRD